MQKINDEKFVFAVKLKRKFEDVLRAVEVELLG